MEWLTLEMSPNNYSVVMTVMEVLGAVAATVLNCLCTCMNKPGEEQCKHVINPTEEIGILRSKKTDLIPKFEDVKRRLWIAEKERKTPTNDVQNWLKKVIDFMVEVDGLEEKATVSRRCLNGLLPNYRSRLNLGRDITKLIKEVTHLLEEANGFSEDNKIAFHVPDVGMEIPSTSIIGKATAEKNLELVWKSLMDDETRIIGVYGMGGVGKTTMMKEINNRLLDQKHRFDKVIWVTVSKDGNVHRLQCDIAKHVGVDPSFEQDETRRSALLLKALRAQGRIVLILDDMWDSFSLSKIGIPEQDGSKLVLTTRSLEVCQRMRCKKNVIKVELLLEDEAWELFYKTVDVGLAPQVEKIAKDVAKECSRLPLAIITVGEAMRGKDSIREWRVALTDLRHSKNRIFNMEEQVIECLKFSYNRLGDDIYKRCFLYFALWPEDYTMALEDLIQYWVMEGLVSGKSIEDEVDRGYVVLNKLKNCCLLDEDGKKYTDGDERVKMHDLIRDMALDIAKEMNPGIMAKFGVRLEDFPDEDVERASFIGSGIKEILISPNCPRLTTLLLNETRSLKHITPSFFVHMLGLRVLNISGSTIELLPESISDLANLQVLDLSRCRCLRRVPSVEKLQSLKVLRLDWTRIEELPHGMEALINLKHLHMAGETKVLREIPAFLPNFCLLQELFAPSVGVKDRHHVDALLSLSHLESLSISFESLSDFCYYVGSDKFKGLNYFSLEVGRMSYTYGILPRISRSVAIYKNSGHQILENALLLPQNTEILNIWEFNELTSLVCLKDVRELRICTICSCSELGYILSSEENDHILQDLEILCIINFDKLINFYKGVVPEPIENFSILPCLMELKIKCCKNLKYLFSSKLLKHLQNLVDVHIEDCKALEELIAEEEEEEDTRNEGSKTILLPRLKRLHLRKLPELNSIWKGEMVCDSLQTVQVYYCEKLKRLPQFSGDGQSPPSSLKEIKGSRAWWNTLEWHCPLAKFQQLFHAEKDCFWHDSNI